MKTFKEYRAMADAVIAAGKDDAQAVTPEVDALAEETLVRIRSANERTKDVIKTVEGALFVIRKLLGEYPSDVDFAFNTVYGCENTLRDSFTKAYEALVAASYAFEEAEHCILEGQTDVSLRTVRYNN